MSIILIAVDGSPHAPLVVKTAATAARAMHARAVLFRAIMIPQEFPAAATTTYVDTLPAYLDAEARVQLTALRETIPDILCDLKVEHSSQPWRAILDQAKLVDADLIVLGSHGYHGWDHILGTTAGQVANRAHRDVLIVHDRQGKTAVDP